MVQNHEILNPKISFGHHPHQFVTGYLLGARCNEKWCKVRIVFISWTCRLQFALPWQLREDGKSSMLYFHSSYILSISALYPWILLITSSRKQYGVETCNLHSMLMNFHFCKCHIWKLEELMNTSTRNYLPFQRNFSHSLNFCLKYVVNFSQKLKNSISVSKWRALSKVLS